MKYFVIILAVFFFLCDPVRGGEVYYSAVLRDGKVLDRFSTYEPVDYSKGIVVVPYEDFSYSFFLCPFITGTVPIQLEEDEYNTTQSVEFYVAVQGTDNNIFYIKSHYQPYYKASGCLHVDLDNGWLEFYNISVIFSHVPLDFTF